MLKNKNMAGRILSKTRYILKMIEEKTSHSIFLYKNKSLKEANKIFTHLTTAEKRKLFDLATKVKDGGYALEIGSYLGASACFIAAGLRDNYSKLLCIDTWENDAMSEGRRNTENEFDENTKQFQKKIVKIKGYSYHVVNKVKNITTSIDLLFIDGDHSFKGCKADWVLYSPFLKQGSIVVFHDYGWAEGVKKVIEEHVKPKLSYFDSLPNMFWGYIK